MNNEDSEMQELERQNLLVDQFIAVKSKAELRRLIEEHPKLLERRSLLRDGVEECLKLLGNGFLTHKDNEELRQKIKSKQLTPAQFYRELLRIIYRFLFLLVSEDRGLISPNPVYRDYYGHMTFMGVARLAQDRAVEWENCFGGSSGHVHSQTEVIEDLRRERKFRFP
jgi:hypothetical protein